MSAQENPGCQGAGSERDNSTPRIKKRRSNRACLGCRERKVRCDVAVHGVPCTNCKLDYQECTVKPRAPRRTKPVIDLAKHREQQEEANQQNQQQESSSTAPSMASYQQHNPVSESNPTPTDYTWDPPSPTEARPLEVYEDWSPEDTTQVDVTPGFDTQAFNPKPEPQLVSSPDTRVRCGGWVPFHCYRFVEAEYIWRLEQGEVIFLEQRKCFQLPGKGSLNAFVKAYYMYIHPFLPFLNEADFWASYSNRDEDLPVRERIPLFILQAILFVACPYVPSSTLRSLGFTTTQEARSEFYSRAKALFNIDELKDHVFSAQAALLLTYHAPTLNDQSSLEWLATAARFAQRAQAHRHSAEEGPQRRLKLKRLWWCCIIRDRIMALGLRRPPHIQLPDLDLSQDILTESDFQDEIRESAVYAPPTKQLMVQLIVALCELMSPLESVLAVANLTARPGEDGHRSSPEESGRCLDELDRWYRKAVARFRTPAIPVGMHESLVLFTKMLYIYYHTAKELLCHRIIVHSVADTACQDSTTETWVRVQTDINTSRRKIAENLMDILRRGLAQYLPNTFVAFSAFPFAWCILETKVLGSSHCAGQYASHMQTYTSIMRGFRSQYESANDILRYIQVVVQYVQAFWSGHDLQEQAAGYPSPMWPKAASMEVYTGPGPQSSPNAWTNLLRLSPRKYCWLVLTVEHFLSHGNLSIDSDLAGILEPDNTGNGFCGELPTMNDFEFYQYLQKGLDASQLGW